MVFGQGLAKGEADPNVFFGRGIVSLELPAPFFGNFIFGFYRAAV